MTDVFRNPSDKEINRLLKEHSALRAAKDHQTGDIYVWDAEGALHNDIIGKLPQNGMVDSAGTIWGLADYKKIRK